MVFNSGMDKLKHYVSAHGLTPTAGVIGVSVQRLGNWLDRGIPMDQCAKVEVSLGGAVAVEDMRPDINWLRVKDKSWPHPKGRPVIDVGAPAKAEA